MKMSLKWLGEEESQHCQQKVVFVVDVVGDDVGDDVDYYKQIQNEMNHQLKGFDQEEEWMDNIRH